MLAARLLSIAFVVLFLDAAPARGDSWALPMTEHYFSENKEFRFTVTPRSLTSPFGFFRDKTMGREPAGQLPGGTRVSTGILSRMVAADSYQTVWQQSLGNDVAPVSAIVHPSGRYIATFDNWHSLGYGKNVVVIYGPYGHIVRQFALSDLLSMEEIARLPRTVSSIWWGRGHAFDESGKLLVLRVVTNGIRPGDEGAEFRPIRIELASGKILPS